jgi:putative membrane protein
MQEETPKPQGLSKDEMAAERTILALERTLLAMIRTATTLLTFGFSIIKLLEEKVHQGTRHPILDVVSPKWVGTIMIFAGFIGLLLSTIHYVKLMKRMGYFTPKVYFSSSMIISYVILLLDFLMLLGTVVFGN